MAERPDCGTAAAYRRHVAAREECAACRRALLARLERETHGRQVTYRLEGLLGLRPCVVCREWMRARVALRQAQRAATRAVGDQVAPVVGEIPRGAQTGVQPFGAVA